MQCSREGEGARADVAPQPGGVVQGSLLDRPMTADLSALDIERRLTAIEATLPTFATKADIHSLRADIQVMRSEWKADLGEMKADPSRARGADDQVDCRTCCRRSSGRGRGGDCGQPGFRRWRRGLMEAQGRRDRRERVSRGSRAD